MNKLLSYLCSTKSPILSLSFIVLAALSMMSEASAQPVSPSPAQLPTTSNFIPTADIPTPLSIVSNLSQSSPVDTITAQGISGRSVLIREMRGNLTIQGKSVKVGDRLSVSDNEIVTDNNSTATLEIDNNTGIIELAENTAIKIETLSTDPTKPVTGIFVIRGRVRLSIAKFVSKYATTSSTSNQPGETQIAGLSNLTGIGEINQLAQTTSSAKNAPVRVRTPRGVAGVRGTSFGVNVGPDGKTGVDTIDGSVGVLGTSKEVAVNAGYWSIINPEGEPTVTKINPALSTIRIRSLSRLGSRNFRLIGQVQPMDLLYVNGQAIVTDAEGKFRIEGELPSGRRVKIVVRGPSVRERVYELAVP